MTAPRTTSKPPKASNAIGGLAALGIRLADSGPHTSKTLMLQQLESLLAAVLADAPAKAYRATIVAEKVLGKGTISARKETASRLSALNGFDPSKPLFRVLRRRWGATPTNRIALASNSQLVDGRICIWNWPLPSVVMPSIEEEG
jgi:hypothetical protein